MKRKKIILLFLAIMMSLLLIFNQSAHSSADDTSQTAAAVGRDRSAEVSADEVEIQFTNKDTKLEAKTNVVGNGHGSAFPSFEININLSKLSSPGGKDKDHAEDQTDYPKTNDFDRLKEGDFILIPIPKEVQLRDYFFANKDNPFFLEEDVNGKKIRHAVVTKVEERDPASNELQKHFLKVTFNENVNQKNFVRANIKFESTVKVVEDGDINFDFNIFGKEVRLTVQAKKKFVFIDHILKKDAANVEELENGKYGLFKFTLLGNRKQQSLNTVIIEDELVNASPNKAFEFEGIGFDKTSFLIQEGNFSADSEKEIVNPKRIYSTSAKTYPTELGEYDDEKGTYTFDNGNIVLSFDKKEKPHKFQLLVKNPGNKGYNISYGVKVPTSEIGRGYVLANNYKMLDENLEEIPLGYTEDDKKPIVKKELKFLASGSITSSLRGKIMIKKHEEGTQKPVKDAVFQIFVENEANFLSEKKTDENGNLVFDNLELGKDKQNPIIYEIKEISAPAGYDQPDPSVVVKKISLYRGDSNSNDQEKKWGQIDAVVSVKNKRKTIDIKVEKIWAGEGAEEKEVTFTLKRKVKDSAEEAVEIMQGADKVVRILQADKDASNNFVTFENMLQYNDNNEEYEYYVNESQIDGYQSSGEAKVVQDSADMIWKAVITNTKEQKNPPVQPQQPPVKPDPEPSEPSESSDGNSGSGTISKVEKIVPKEKEQPKPQDPKPEQPKAEEPKSEQPKPEQPKTEEPKSEQPKPEQPKTEEPKSEQPKVEEPQVPQPGTEVSTEKITVGGSAKEGNDTNVLPDSIPNVSSQKDSKNKTQVDPQSLKKLPKTGEGLNSVAYTAIFALLGMSLIGFGAYRKLKSAK